MKGVGIKMGWRSTATAALVCALIATLVVGVASAAAEEGDSAPLRPLSEGGFSFPAITDPTAPEEFPFELNLSPQLKLRQVSDQVVAVEYFEYGIVSYTFTALAAHDVVGATVPTTLMVTGGDVITLAVKHRAGNPVAGGAPFEYPVSGGPGWEGGYYVSSYEMNNAPPPPSVAPAPFVVPPTCVVPGLRGLSLHAAKTRLRAAHCSIGEVRLGDGATAGKGKVVRQFRLAGAELPAGAPVPVKLGPPR